MENFISQNSYSVRKKIELMSNEAVKQAFIAGLGFSIMPLIGITNELKYQYLQIIPVRNLPIHTDWNLVWLNAKKLSPDALANLEYLDKNKNITIETSFSWINEFSSHKLAFNK